MIGGRKLERVQREKRNPQEQKEAERQAELEKVRLGKRRLMIAKSAIRSKEDLKKQLIELQSQQQEQPRHDLEIEGLAVMSIMDENEDLQKKVKELEATDAKKEAELQTLRDEHQRMVAQITALQAAANQPPRQVKVHTTEGATDSTNLADLYGGEEDSEEIPEVQGAQQINVAQAGHVEQAEQAGNVDQAGPSNMFDDDDSLTSYEEQKLSNQVQKEVDKMWKNAMKRERELLNCSFQSKQDSSRIKSGMDITNAAICPSTV
ncbi:hypothetical protein GOP47_0004586 [Adiantum capillus-veneris]|uniref:Uncharacterized protein n=1 Tax=Adiantum capillus-veneris TaxID=13818 RepID=A0A9D4V856_ADICA|nr:hypothetical protein GOP47_0004586 [Adiantum capillus-veneris]